MCIYCGTNKYRKIYENHIGYIPKDTDGRSYDIHHIDGNHSNNDPSNLKAVTITEHYQIHFDQEDYGACWLLGRKIKMSKEEISDLATRNNNKMIIEGKHPLMKRRDGTSMTSDRVSAGTHSFIGGDIQRKTAKKLIDSGAHHFMKRADGSSLTGDRIANGTHPFVNSDWQRENTLRQLANGNHPSQVSWKCSHCGVNGHGSTNYKRWHGDNCRVK